MSSPSASTQDNRKPNPPTISVRGEGFIVDKLGPGFKPTLQSVLAAARFDCAITVQARDSKPVTDNSRGLRIRRPVHNGVECTWVSYEGTDCVILTVQTPTAFVRNADMLHRRMAEGMEELSRKPAEIAPTNATSAASETTEEQVSSVNAVPTQPPSNEDGTMEGDLKVNRAASTDAQPAAPQTELPPGERIKAYLAQHNITVNEFAGRCGVGPHTVNKVCDGQSVRESSLKHIRAVLDGKKSSADVGDERPEFDKTTEDFIYRILEMAKDPDVQSGLLSKLFHRIVQASPDPDEGRKMLDDMFRDALVLASEGADRLTMLIELHAVVKEASRPPR